MHNDEEKEYGQHARFEKPGKILGMAIDPVDGTLAFDLDGKDMGIAFRDERLKTLIFPVVELIHSS